MPVAWTIKGESGKAFDDSTVTLASQSISGAVVEFRSLEADKLTLDYQLADYVSASTLPELRQSVTIFRDGTRFFTGTVTSVSPKISAASQTVRIVVSGPWWWLERIPMTYPQIDGEGGSAERPMYVFGDFTTGGDMALYLEHAIDRTITLGAPIIRGSIAASFTVPRITLSQQMCGEVISELVRLIPDTMVWFDYSLSSTDNPTIKVERRGAATTRTLTVGTDELTEIDVEPIIELEVAQVKVPYVTRSATGETQYTTQDSGSAATGKVEILPISGPELVDFLPNDQLDTLKIENAYDGDLAGLALAVKKVIYPGWADVVASVAGSEGVNYGLDVTDTYIYSSGGDVTVNRNLSSATGGGTTEDYPAGTTALAQTAIPGSKKFLCFENGQEPPQWAIDDYSLTEYYPAHVAWWDQNLGGGSPTYDEERRFAIMEATQWSISRSSTSNAGIDNSGAGTYMYAIWLPEKSAKIWLCDTSKVPADNILIRDEDFTFAAPPASFAANLLAAQNWIPYQGAIRLSSADVGATRYRGCKVNLAGSLSALTSMGALVSEESVNIAEGTTEITLGQPPRLDFTEFASRVRRTPQDNTNYITVASYNATAKTYFDEVEDNDSFTFKNYQKAAISTFFNALVTAGIDSKVKSLHFYGANEAVALRNAMSPVTVYASWTVTPASGDFKEGYLVQDGEHGTLARTCAELGLASDSMGGFVTVTNVPDITGASWLNSYASSSANFQIKQDTSEMGCRFCFSSTFKGQTDLRKGAFVATRNGSGTGSCNVVQKTYSGGLETNTASRTGGSLPTNDVAFLGTTLECEVSIMGVTTGLTQVEAQALANAAYECAIGVGHTAIGTT